MPKIDIFVFFKALEYPKSCEVYRTKNSLFVLKSTCPAETCFQLLTAVGRLQKFKIQLYFCSKEYCKNILLAPGPPRRHCALAGVGVVAAFFCQSMV